MFEKIKKIKKIIKAKVAAFRERVAALIKTKTRRFEAEKSKEEGGDLLCRSTVTYVDRHRDNILLFLQFLPIVQREVNASSTSQSYSSQMSLYDESVKNSLNRLKAPSQLCPADPPIVLRSEKPKASSPEEDPSYSTKIRSWTYHCQPSCQKLTNGEYEVDCPDHLIRVINSQTRSMSSLGR